MDWAVPPDDITQGIKVIDEPYDPAKATDKDTLAYRELAKLYTAYRCNNTAACPAQLSARIEYMASRPCLNLAQMGSELCAEIAFRAGLELDNFRHPFDLLDVPPSWFANLSWTTEAGGKMTFGASRAATLEASMKAASGLPLRNWIAALGIHSIGKNTSKEITRLVAAAEALRYDCLVPAGVFARMVDSLGQDPKKTEYERLKAAYSISHHLGPVSLLNLVAFVRSEEGAYAISRIPGTVKSDNYDCGSTGPSDSGPLSGKSFVITGTLSVPRQEIQKLIEDAGGSVMGSISSKTSVLVAGEKAGSKLVKASKLGVVVWNEEQLRKEIEG